MHAGKKAQQARVQEVELGRFNQPLPIIVVKRLQQVNDIAGLQDGQPALDGVRAHSRVRAEGVHRQNLPRAQGQQAQKLVEGRQVFDIDQLSDISLQIGGEVIGVEPLRLEALGVDFRVPPLEHPGQQLPGGERFFGVAAPLQLPRGQGMALENGNPARKTFPDPFHQ